MLILVDNINYVILIAPIIVSTTVAKAVSIIHAPLCHIGIVMESLKKGILEIVITANILCPIWIKKSIINSREIFSKYKSKNQLNIENLNIGNMYSLVVFVAKM